MAAMANASALRTHISPRKSGGDPQS